ncbi:hypothetical protein B0H13DRAFT_2323076 [Mycena leptocephala]|nr:hypothetical protein B0H13DRAFT_2323076 [Mycena leptocephala]
MPTSCSPHLLHALLPMFIMDNAKRIRLSNILVFVGETCNELDLPYWTQCSAPNTKIADYCSIIHSFLLHDYAGEMAMKKRTPCYCALQAKMHYVDNIDMDDHLENLATFLAQRDNNVASTVQTSDAEPIGPLTDLLASLKFGESNEIEQLADFVTGLTIVDNGPDLANQPSKLFTPREEFQQSRTSHIPTGFDPTGITAADATSSISALFTASPPSNAHDERVTGLANATLQLIRDAEASLAISLEYDETDPTAVAEMHEKLNAATAVFFNCKHTLDKIRRNVPEMAGARAALGDLDMKIREIEERMKGLEQGSQPLERRCRLYPTMHPM